MNVFILCTGRCGSTTFVRACGHLTNFTAGHETQTRIPFSQRPAYPPNHIEADNRLAWFLGGLDAAYGDDAYYVHLTRDPDAVAKSFAGRWKSVASLAVAYRNGLLMGAQLSLEESSRDMVATITANIALFLRGKRNVMRMQLETMDEDFPRFLDWIGAEGDRGAAIGEWSRVHNPTPPESARTRLVARLRMARRAMLLPR